MITAPSEGVLCCLGVGASQDGCVGLGTATDSDGLQSQKPVVSLRDLADVPWSNNPFAWHGDGMVINLYELWGTNVKICEGALTTNNIRNFDHGAAHWTLTTCCFFWTPRWAMGFSRFFVPDTQWISQTAKTGGAQASHLEVSCTRTVTPLRGLQPMRTMPARCRLQVVEPRKSGRGACRRLG